MALGPIGTIVKAISDPLVAALAAGGYPALVDGKILVGPAALNAHSSPPRVVFVPVANELGPANTANPTNNSSTNRSINIGKTLMSEWLTFEVHVWGAAASRDDEASQSGDYDAARTLYQQVLRFIVLALGPYSNGPRGIVKFSEVSWNDADATVTRLGREAIFTFAVSTPVLDALLAYAPSDVTRAIGVTLSPGDNPPVHDQPIQVT